MKKIIVLLSILFFALPVVFCYGESIDKTMAVPFTEKQLSDLTYVIKDTAHISIYSALSLVDEKKVAIFSGNFA